MSFDLMLVIWILLFGSVINEIQWISTDGGSSPSSIIALFMILENCFPNTGSYFLL